MKNVFAAVVLVVLSGAAALSQSVADIVYKQDLQKVVEQLNKANARLDSLIRATTPVVPIPKCDKGPTVAAISKVSTTSLTARITGEGFTKLTVSIFDEDSTTLYLTKTFTYNNPEDVLTYNLLPGKYRLYAKAVDCSGTGSRAFTIKGEPGTKPDCPRGPTIYSTPIVATTSAVTFQFDGEGVDSLSWEVRKAVDNSLQVFGDIKPTRNVITAPYGKVLAGGEYTLVIRGKSCVSKDDSRGFKIDAGNGGGPSNPPPVSTGKAVPKRIVSGLPRNINIYAVKNPSGPGWLLSDSSTTTPIGNHRLWYGINNTIINTDAPLKNYLWPSNTPLQVWKAMPKNGIKTLAQWSENSGMYVPDAANSFDFGESYPHNTFYFQPADSAINVNSQVPNWMDIMPDMTLPLGNVWVMPIGDIDSPDLLIRKGVTHFSKYQISGKPYDGQMISAGRVYDEVPKTYEQFSLTRGTGVSNWVPKKNGGRLPINADPVPWPSTWNEMFFGELREGQREPLTYEEGKEAGRRYQTVMPVVVFENSENTHAVGSQWSFVGGFYETYMPRMRAAWEPKGIEPLVAHNYFTGFGGGVYTLGFTSMDEHLGLLRKPISQWPGTSLLDGTLKLTNAVCYGYYLGAPDRTLDEAYRFIWSGDVAHAAGKHLLFFPQSMHEDRPNNFMQVRYPDGNFYVRIKQRHNPAELITMSFLAQWNGKGTIPFGAGPKTKEEFRFRWEFHANEGNLWQRKGSSELSQNPNDFPYYIHQGGEVFPNGSFEYALAEGVRLYTSTFAQVKGGIREYLEYRIDGGEWIKPVNQYSDDVVKAFFFKSPIVVSERKNGVTAVFYLWPYADTNLHTLEYKLNGQTFTKTVHSTIIHPYVHK